MSAGKQSATRIVNDERLSLAALKKLPKATLRAKAASYGLPQTGKKDSLANRIYRHLRSPEETATLKTRPNLMMECPCCRYAPERQRTLPQLTQMRQASSL